MSSDMGPIGFPAQQWLLSGVGLKGSTSWDVFHRLIADLSLATTGAGLTLIRLEAVVINKLRKGPFKPGGQNAAVMHGAASEMFDLLDENCLSFELLYHDISRFTYTADPDVGTEDHRRRL